MVRPEIEFLRRRLGDRVILPGDKVYDAGRRLFNHGFDPHPAALVYCHTEPDVTLCLEAARKYRMPFRLRSGGHSVAGYSGCDGMIIDLSGLNGVSIESTALVATVAAGCQQGKLNRILDEHGVHLPLGDAMDVCVAGFMQGGGWGVTSRTFGMNSDHVLEVRVMLADGRVVRASETINHDLWWAVRGGTGGSFGVLLGIRYRLHRAPEISYWCLSWPLCEPSNRDMAALALMALQKELLQAGAIGMNAAAFAVYVADKPDDPPKTPWLVMWGAYVGSQPEMSAALRPLLSVPGCNHGFNPAGMGPAKTSFGRTSRYVSRELTSNDWRRILDHFVSAPNPSSALHIHGMGGAINSYPRERSAFTHRDAAFNIFLDVFWADEIERDEAKSFIESWCSLVEPFWNSHIYQNFPSPNAPDYRWNYWGNAFPALAAVKRKYDPDRLFEFPQVVAPRHGESSPVEWPPMMAEALKEPIRTEA